MINTPKDLPQLIAEAHGTLSPSEFDHAKRRMPAVPVNRREQIDQLVARGYLRADAETMVDQKGTAE